MSVAVEPQFLPCKLCGKKSHVVFGLPNSKIAGQPIPNNADDCWYYQCDKCNFLFTPALDDKDHAEIYDEFYWSNQESDWYGRVSQTFRLVAMANELLRRRIDRFEILDFGCGAGAFVELGRKHLALDVWGTDINPPKVGKEWFLPDLGARKFDVIVACEVIEHLPNPREVFSRLREHLKSPVSSPFKPRIGTQNNWAATGGTLGRTMDIFHYTVARGWTTFLRAWGALADACGRLSGLPSEAVGTPISKARTFCTLVGRFGKSFEHDTEKPPLPMKYRPAVSTIPLITLLVTLLVTLRSLDCLFRLNFLPTLGSGSTTWLSLPNRNAVARLYATMNIIRLSPRFSSAAIRSSSPIRFQHCANSLKLTPLQKAGRSSCFEFGRRDFGGALRIEGAGSHLLDD